MMNTRRLGSLEVSEIGFGNMGLSIARRLVDYGDDAFRHPRRAARLRGLSTPGPAGIGRAKHRGQ